MPDDFDVIIVGAGPSGIAAAYILAKAGLSTVVFERGEFPGSKNVMGGILYGTVLNRLIPEFWKEAPIERHITKRCFSLLSADGELSLCFRADRFNQPPFNNSFSVLRAKFDRWFAQKAVEAGAIIIPGTVVDDLLTKNGKVIGVRTRREQGDVYAPVVINAEGANSFLTMKMGLRGKFPTHSMAVAVKEVLALPRGIIEDRFSLDGEEGTAIEYFGDAVKGLIGLAFIYTNKETLSVGLGCTVASVMEKKITPNELIEGFKAHPSVKRLIKGAELQEFSAHMIPEGGYTSLPQLVSDGLIIVGDAAGFVNTSFYHEGSNLAMASGVLAAETVIEAKTKENYNKGTLNSYAERLGNSFVINDLKKYRRLPEFASKNPRFFKEYPDLFLDLATDFFSVSEKSKAEIQKEVIKKFRSKISLWRFILDINKFRKAMFG